MCKHNNIITLNLLKPDVHPKEWAYRKGTGDAL